MVERDPQSLLAAYRSGLGPSQAAENRMLTSLRSQILVLPDPTGGGGIAGGGATGGGAAGGGASVASGGATVAAKIAAVVLSAAVGVATVTVAVIRREPAQPARASIEPTSQPIEEVAPIPPEPAPPPVVQLEAPLPVEPEIQAPPEVPQPRTAPRRRTKIDEAQPAPSLADEAKLLRSADVALRKGDLATARTQLGQYRDSFATGTLRAQADELELLLACANDPETASKRARDHLDAHPNSRARTRIEDACGLR